jgi:hypothetical protein
MSRPLSTSLRTLLLLAALLAPGLTRAAAPTKQEKAAIVEQLRVIAYAVQTDDADTPIKQTPDVVVQAFGGYDLMKQATLSAYKQMKALGLKLESFTVSDDFDYFAGDKNEFMIIRQTKVMRLQGKLAETLGFMLAVRPKTAGEKWKFIDGGQLTPDIARHFFPDFPAKELPKVQQKILPETKI